MHIGYDFRSTDSYVKLIIIIRMDKNKFDLLPHSHFVYPTEPRGANLSHPLPIHNIWMNNNNNQGVCGMFLSIGQRFAFI